MCVTLYKQRTEKLKKRGQYIWGWKVVERFDSDRGTNLCSSIFHGYIWKPGVNKSKTRVKNEIKDSSFFYTGPGFYVYLKKPLDFDYSDMYYRLIRVKCQIKDLIGSGINVAVFKKVELSQKEYDSATTRKEYR